MIAIICVNGVSRQDLPVEAVQVHRKAADLGIMKENGSETMRTFGVALIGLAAFVAAWGSSIQPLPAVEDSRELVKLPPMMQEHMLGNMRDHLVALDEILAALAEGNTDDAAGIAEKRLGMSSLSLHGASHMAKFMPETMRAIGTQMHRAASRFVIIAKDAELEPGLGSQRKVYRALQAITENCNACHQAYRIR